MMRRFLFALALGFMLASAAANTANAASARPAMGRAIEFLGAIEDRVLGDGNDSAEVQDIVANVVQIILSLTGLVFIVLIIYGGYMWGTARGNTDKVDTGRKLIFEAIIGVIIVFGAYILTAFVIQSVGEATLESGMGYYYR